MDEDLYRESLELHRQHRGKLEVHSKVRLKTKHDLSLAYTPGVARVCREIQDDPARAYDYTMKANTVAIVTDGSAVLGLGNIGGTAAIPVMEGKAILFREFAGIDAIPICFAGYHIDFVEDVRNIAPVFGGINLEDIAAPKCFAVEEALQDLGIPVMHDDQHGTAVVVLAALLNACRVTGKRFEDLTVAVSGAGAAGYAVTRMLACFGMDREACSTVRDVIAVDRTGIIYRGRPDLLQNKYKYILAHETNTGNRQGTLADAMAGADAFIGVSAGGIVTEEMVRSMAPDPIVFAMANPTPEILPEAARRAGAAVVGTGRSDYPNQINNVLAFPGIFRGALDARAATITDAMKLAAAHALADFVVRPHRDHILPSILDKRVTAEVAAAVRDAAVANGVAGLP
ncbi:NADP-dependent malic enzyme [Methanoculleus sp. FWC-SCC1]|uniref:NADP-dependent malic enzyme n=1 Tax=Methanoculleus frigidifontis TaxID=2584085 RepID=A0ABT8MCC9_9EURY|nr:NADP-dependent malic enzyme [Methanoculleus sp. FWC-SCC1]MDN7025546.1 NADP-dependent malic enzyme [Methanoculleus sp. FWC-SCC1]